MSEKIVNAIYNPGEVNAGASPALNLNYGGQFGYMSRHGYLDKASGKFYGEWLSGSPYIRENMIPVLLAYPKFIDLLPDPERWKGIFKNVMENIPQSIDGIRMTLSVEHDSTAVGAYEQFEVATRVTRERSEPNYTYKERQGRPLSKFFEFWIVVGIQDPDTLVPRVYKYLKDPKSNAEFGMYTPEFNTCTMLYIEPSNLNTTVEQAALVFNMQPKAGAPEEMVRNLTAAKEGLEFSIGFTGMTMSTPPVKKLAKSILDRMTSLRETPDVSMTIPIDDIHPDLSSENNTAHGFEDGQGNGKMTMDPYPPAGGSIDGPGASAGA